MQQKLYKKDLENIKPEKKNQIAMVNTYESVGFGLLQVDNIILNQFPTKKPTNTFVWNIYKM